MCHHALEAAEKLAEEGIDAEVIDLRTMRPLDTETIVESVKKTNRLVTVEEGWLFAGIGYELAAVAMQQDFDWLAEPVDRVAGRHLTMPFAATPTEHAFPQVETIRKEGKN